MNNFHKKEQGSILFICLFIMLIVSISALSMASMSILQERIAGNVLEQSYSALSADAALEQAAKNIQLYKDTSSEHVYKEDINGNSLYAIYSYKLLGNFSYTSSIGSNAASYALYGIKVTGYGRNDNKEVVTQLFATYLLRE